MVDDAAKKLQINLSTNRHLSHLHLRGKTFNMESTHHKSCQEKTRNEQEEIHSLASDQVSQVEEVHFTEEVQSLTSEEVHFTEEVQSLTSDQDAQVEEKHDENYLDTALEDPLVWSDSHDTVCPRHHRTFANNCGYEGNGSNSLCGIYSNRNPSKPESIKTSNQPTKVSAKFADDVSHDPIVSNADIDIYIDFESTDCQYSSDCGNSLQTEESGVFSSISDKYSSINKQNDLLSKDTSNTKSEHCNISEKLVESRHFESVQCDSGINSYCAAVTNSTHSEISSESLCSLMYGSVLLGMDGEFIRSLYMSCRSYSIEDTFYSTQSELPEVLLQNQNKSILIIQSESMPSPCYCPKRLDAVPSEGWSESQFSLQPEFSHGRLEKGPYSAELISSPIECTDKSELTISDQLNISGLREFGHSMQLEASLYKTSQDAAYSRPKMLLQSDSEMESISISHCLSPFCQRLPEMQSLISDQVPNKSRDFAFCKTINADVLHKSKVTFKESAFEIHNETGSFNMVTTEINVHEKPYLIKPKVFCERIQWHINVQNRVYYWRQVMQLYFTLMTALSFGGSLKWLFQLRPVRKQAVQRLQSILTYPFTNLNEFFNCKSRESPPTTEECMSVEWMRLQTFQNYPVTAHGSPIRLAREGFFYTGQGTQTRCFSCGVSHGEWNYFDNPHEVHLRLSPNCPFLNGRQEGHRNIPMSPGGSGDVDRTDRDSSPSLPFGSDTGQSQMAIGRSESREIPRASKTTDDDGTIGQQHKSGSGETTPKVQSHPVEESAQSEIDKRPKFPEHVSLPSRIATFSHGWPPYLDQTPQQMAEAGFFFTGNQDYTKCYQCGGGLRNWEPGDNPWIEHCRWYPTCPHVEKGKGQRFVNAVLKKQAELLSTQRAESRRKAQYGISNNDPLETLAAISLMEMGYPRDTVHNSILILRRQREPGAEITALEVLKFIWKEEDIERQRQEEEASRPHHPGDAQPQALPTLMERLNLGGSPSVTQAAVLQSASITTSASSPNSSAARMMTSVTMATGSTTGTSSITSVSTPASGSTQITSTRVSEGNVSKEIAAQNDRSEKGEPRPSGAEGGQSEGPGAHAQAVAAVIDEDEEFHSLDSEEMENKDCGEIEEENKRLKEQTTCKICMENPVRVIFLPCGHLVCCEVCAPAFRKCPICRKRIQQSVKTLL